MNNNRLYRRVIDLKNETLFENDAYSIDNVTKGIPENRSKNDVISNSLQSTIEKLDPHQGFSFMKRFDRESEVIFDPKYGGTTRYQLWALLFKNNKFEGKDQLYRAVLFVLSEGWKTEDGISEEEIFLAMASTIFFGYHLSHEVVDKPTTCRDCVERFDHFESDFDKENKTVKPLANVQVVHPLNHETLARILNLGSKLLSQEAKQKFCDQHYTVFRDLERNGQTHLLEIEWKNASRIDY